MEDRRLQMPHQRVFSVEVAAATMCGPVRKENQDAIVFNGWMAQKSESFLSVRYQSTPLFSAAVVDGMGGYEGGSDAACLAAAALSKYDLRPNSPSSADEFCTELSKRILLAGHSWNQPHMGAAFAMITIEGDCFTVANVGDCRVYQFESGLLGCLTEDDCLMSGASGLTQSLGVFEARLDSHALTDRWGCEKLFLLCSDGVWKTVGDEQLQAACDADSSNPSSIVNRIMGACERMGAQDNCSTIVVKAKHREVSCNER